MLVVNLLSKIQRGKVIIMCLLITLPLHSFSQTERSVWGLGYGRPSFSMIFSTSGITFDSIPGPNYCPVMLGCASIADSTGNLLFLCNGFTISNKIGQPMVNGQGLSPTQFSSVYANSGNPTPGSVIAIPDPLNNSEFYLFHYSTNYSTLKGDSLHYSKINMNLDNGHGAVTIKNQVLAVDSFTPGQLAAVKHANGRDYWLIAHQFNSNLYYKFLISTNGISLIDTQSIGHAFRNSGESMFSPDGNFYASYQSFNKLDLFSFDRCSGRLFNDFHYAMPDSTPTFGFCFSPNSQLIYISGRTELYQMDITVSDPYSTLDTVAIYDGFANPEPTTFCMQQLAPDGKIYIASFGSTKYLHVIEYPDIYGIGCNVRQLAITLPYYNNGTVPNLPFYELGKDIGSLCDTITDRIKEIDISMINLYYENNLIKVRSFSNIDKLKLYNIQGKLIIQTLVNNTEADLNTEAIRKGIYILEAEFNTQKFRQKVVIN